jgi:glycosyltransferase involved in cell wall biosynthesis
MQEHAAAKIPFFGRFAAITERRVLATYTDIITVSPSLRDLVSSIRGQSGTHLVYNGVDPECFVDDPIEEDYILSFGRLDTYTKGLDLLVQAFRRVAAVRPGIRLVIAGRGGVPEVRKLTQLVDSSSLQGRVDIRCNVSREDKKELFRRALFNIAASRYEGWCIAAVEASAASKAVIGTRIPGLIDAIRDGETGLLVEPENADALADAILRLCEDKDLRSTLGRSGRAWAERFSWDRVARDQEAVYLNVMASRERFDCVSSAL